MARPPPTILTSTGSVRHQSVWSIAGTTLRMRMAVCRMRLRITMLRMRVRLSARVWPSAVKS